LEMIGYGPDNVTEVMWPDAMPINALEAVQVEQAKLAMGIESKQTAAMALGLDWDAEQERMDAEQEGQADLGTMLLSAFERGATNIERGNGRAQREQQPERRA
jgi:hypothetical protein